MFRKQTTHTRNVCSYAKAQKNPCLRKVIGLQDSTGDFNLSTDDYIGRAVQMNWIHVPHLCILNARKQLRCQVITLHSIYSLVPNLLMLKAVIGNDTWYMDDMKLAAFQAANCLAPKISKWQTDPCFLSCTAKNTQSWLPIFKPQKAPYASDASVLPQHQKMCPCTNTSSAHWNLGTKKIAALCNITTMDISLRPLCCTCRRLHAWWQLSGRCHPF